MAAHVACCRVIQGIYIYIYIYIFSYCVQNPKTCEFPANPRDFNLVCTPVAGRPNVVRVSYYGFSDTMFKYMLESDTDKLKRFRPREETDEDPEYLPRKKTVCVVEPVAAVQQVYTYIYSNATDLPNTSLGQCAGGSRSCPTGVYIYIYIYSNATDLPNTSLGQCAGGSCSCPTGVYIYIFECDRFA